MSSKLHHCPCASGKSYQACCMPLHDGRLNASSAEQLMRSRYSAFYLGDITYLINTLHPDKRQINDKQSLTQSIQHTKWLGLKILKHTPSKQTATVEFVGFYQDDAVDIGQLHERSNFIKQSDQWFYLNGDILPAIKLSRNEQCFCGNGNKFKKCHGA